MNHLPRYKNSKLPQIEVPYLCKEPYDGLEFKDYPKRKGLELKITDLDGTVEKDEADAFLQTWLFFGVLSQTLQVPIRNEDFVTIDPDGTSVLTTVALPGYVQQSEDALKRLSRSDQEGRIRSGAGCLQELHWFLGDYIRYGDAAPPRGVIWLSVNALGSTLVHWLSDMCQVYVGGRFKFQGFSGGEVVLRANMLKEGWCLSEVERLLRKHSVNGVYFASTMDRHYPILDHSLCSRLFCQASIVDLATYNTKHVEDCCRCPFVGPSKQELDSHIQSGGIPVVLLPCEEDLATSSELTIASARSTPFVAISHVWRDGLGNTGQNTLPICQLRRLRSFAQGCLRNAGGQEEGVVPSGHKQGHGETALWIDTLCVPVDGITRKTAIGAMYEIYQEASRVLVLDRDLLLSTCRTTIEENLMRIENSHWMQRLWTFQEGALAQNLDFQFADGILNLPGIISQFEYNIEQDVNASYWNAWDIGQESREVLKNMMQLKRLSGDEKLMAGWNGVIRRATSKIEDEPVIFASLLGMDVRKLLDTPPAKRHQKLFSMFDRFPQDIIFHDGPRLSEPGWQWVPASFRETDRLLFDATLGKCTDNGLLVNMEGIHLIETERIVERHMMLLELEQRRWYQAVAASSSETEEVKEEQWQRVRPQGQSPCAIILLDQDDPNVGQLRGILVSLKSIDDEKVMYVKYHCGIMLVQVPPHIAQQLRARTPFAFQQGPIQLGDMRVRRPVLFEEDRHTVEVGGHRFYFLSGQRTETTLKWCVG
jgi:hypothetical protein